MPGIMRMAVKKKPGDSSMVLVVGKAGAGKTTFISKCTSKKYLGILQLNSSRSQNSSTYTVVSPQGIRHECFYHEEPSFLEDVTKSSPIFYDFVMFLLSEKGKRVAGIVYVLNVEQESVAQQPQNRRRYQVGLRSHLEFVRRYIGTACPKSSVLTRNRAPVGPQTTTLIQNIDHAWNDALENQSLEIRDDDDPKDVVKNLMTQSPHWLKLRQEVIEERKKLQETKVGRLYIEQLESWIAEARHDERKIKEKKGDFSTITEEIKTLRNDLNTWKKLPHPTELEKTVQ